MISENCFRMLVQEFLPPNESPLEEDPNHFEAKNKIMKGNNQISQKDNLEVFLLT